MVCSLNGFRLLKVSTVDWVSIDGVKPFDTVIIVDDDVLSQVIENSLNVTLRIGERYIKKLHIRETISSSGSLGENVTTAVILEDRRYRWQDLKYSASFNIRRRTGEVDIVEDEGTPLAVEDTDPRVKYIPSTIRNGEPYTLKAALSKALRDKDQKPFFFEAGFPEANLFDAKGYENDASLGEIIDGLLSFAPGWVVTCDDDGTFRFYKENDLAADKAADQKIRPKLFGGGWAKKSNRSFIRPSLIRVYNYVEPEVRFDYTETTNRTTTRERSRTQLIGNLAPGQLYPDTTLDAVIDVPVPGLLNPETGRLIARDSQLGYFFFLNLLQIDSTAAFAKYPLSPNAILGPWGINPIHNLYLRPWDVKAQYVHFGGSIDFNWGRITRTSLNSFRSYYRLQADWADAVKAISPFRVEIINRATLTRRKSPVFSNYTSKPALRLSSVFAESDLDTLAWSQKDAVQDFIEDCKRAPAFVTGIDNEAKSFRVVYRRSPRGREEDVLPVTIEEMPKILNASNLRVKLELGQKIDSEFKMSTVLTVVPQPIPGSYSHFHMTEVSPADCASILGISEDELGPCNGPPLEIFIPPSETTTARFYWTDRERTDMIAPFFDQTKSFPISNLQNKEDIEALAKAAGASVMFTRMDTLTGKSTMPSLFAPPKLSGSMKSVRTTASPDDGSPIQTTVSYGRSAQPLNPYALIPVEVRARFLQQIIPGAGSSGESG